MARCKFCHEAITWVRRPDGSWHPPFEQSDDVFELDVMRDMGGNLVPVARRVVPELKPHRCVSTVRDQEPSPPPELQPGPEQQLRLHSRRQQPELDLALPDDLWAELQRLRVEVPLLTDALTREQERREEIKRDAAQRAWPRLSMKCPTCAAPRGVWCTYLETGGDTLRLHTKRLPPKKGS